MKKIYKNIGIVIVLLLFFASILFLIVTSTKKVITITKIDEDVEYSITESDMSKTYKKISKSCVGIYSILGSKSATGSGVVYKKTNNTFYVVTNYHVVKGFENINVYYNGKYEKANLVGGIVNNDVAVLTFSFSANNKELYNEIEVCDFLNYSTTKIPQVGERSLVVGCPLGIENYNVLTAGIITQVTDLDIYTDATINVGNSGGGLFNINGELLGIIYKKESITTSGTLIEGRGSAIPLSIVSSSVKLIEKNNSSLSDITLPFSLICINRVIDTSSAYYQFLPNDSKDSHLIIKNSDINTVQTGDVLLKINGEEMNSIANVMYFLKTTEANTSLTLTMYNNQKGTFEVNLAL